MRKYLSHGVGVNSTALMLLLEDEGVEFESVFVDHGGDYPETKDMAMENIPPLTSWSGTE